MGVVGHAKGLHAAGDYLLAGWSMLACLGVVESGSAW